MPESKTSDKEKQTLTQDQKRVLAELLAAGSGGGLTTEQRHVLSQLLAPQAEDKPESVVTDESRALTVEVPALNAADLSNYADISMTTEVPALDPTEFADIESQSALTDKQRELLNEFRKLRDPVSFEWHDDQFDEPSELSENKLDIMLHVPLDDKEFDTTGGDIDEIPSALNADQIADLEGAKDLHDEDFDSPESKVPSEPATLDDHARAALQVHATLEREAQKEEFLTAAPQELKSEETLRPKEDPAAYAARPMIDETAQLPPPNPLDEVKPMDGDFRKPAELQPEERETTKGKPKGLIGTGNPNLKAIASVARRARQTAPNLVGPAIMTSLCLALYTVPAFFFRAQDDIVSRQMADGEMKGAVNQVLREEVPQQRASWASGIQGSASGGQGGPSSAGAPQVDPALDQANQIASRGGAAAITAYEEYLQIHPESIPVRIKLIGLYIKHNQRAKARVLCVNTLKYKLSDADKEYVLRLFRSVLIDDSQR